METEGREIIRSNKALLAVLTVLMVFASLYTMPRGRSVRYETSEGSPWMYDELIAPSNFSIVKSEADYNRETDSLKRNFIPYFALNEDCASNASSALQKLYEDTLSSAISFSSFRNIQNTLNSLYAEGIIDAEGEDYLKHNGQSLLRGYSGNSSRILDMEHVHTQKDAYRLLAESEMTVSERSLLPGFRLEELMVPNLMFDPERTRTEMEAEAEQVSRYSGMVVAGQKIIDRGEIVSHDTYQMIQSYMEVMNRRTDSTSFTILTWSGNVLFVTLIMLLLTFYIIQYRRDIAENRSRLLFLFAATALFIIGTNLYMRFTTWSIFILPCTMLALMLRIFLDSRTAFMGYLTYLLACSISTPMPFEFLLLQIVAGLTAIYSIHELSQRSQIFRTAFIIFGSYSVIWIALQMMQLEDLKNIQWHPFVYFAINGFIMLLTYPLILAVEKIFGFTSNVTLIELSNINHPLLRKLSETAPGTFQHSMQVSALAAAAANATNASTQLVRTAALYHDIGKLSNPPFFTENQNGVNPHDRLPYEQSAQIITAHVSDGMKLAEKYKLPKDVMHFICTHHGTGMAKYFYIKYVNEHPDELVDKAPFSYSGPEPDSKETAILMMADAVEASSRSLREYNEQTIGELVDRIIGNQLQEGHFLKCPITFSEIDRIKEVFKEKLMTMYHTRISYPEPNRS